MLTVMITPLAFSDEDNNNENRHLSYEEKLQKELDRLDLEYQALEPKEGGAPDVELIDFQQIRLDEIKDLEKGLVELDEVIVIKIDEIKEQNNVIVSENKKIAAAKEQLKKDWNAPAVNTNQLTLELEKLTVLNNELGELQDQKNLVLKQIDSKKLIHDIQKHDAKLIGVKLSKNCEAMAKLKISTCPTYEDLLTLDNSIREVSGEFSFHDGWFHREKSNYQDSFRAYDNDDKIRILVDPPFNEAIRIKMITIESNLGLFAEKGYSTKLVDGQRILAKDRIIQNCYTATISAENYKMLLPDTIFTFRNGCESAEINDII
ncbi:MAG: hypothetical protein CMC98_02900, partial [Flavobacteriales bacterium]|nr:hypothetical protein [Flavobacteriales bacterium]